MYRELLPRLPTPSLRCYGTVRIPTASAAGSFSRTREASPTRPANPEHRRLSARWLAGVQLRGAEILADADLPDRGPRHYLVHLLRPARKSRGSSAVAGRARSGRPSCGTSSPCSMRSSRWRSWRPPAARCPRRSFMATSSRRTCVSPTTAAAWGWQCSTGRPRASAFQSPDLAQLLEPERSAVASQQPSKRFDRFSANPCLDTYRSVLADSATGLEAERVERSAAVGNLFRCVAGINWTCSQPRAPGSDGRPSVPPGWLRGAMPVVGWSSSGRSSLAGVAHGAGEHGTTPLVARGAT